MCSLYIFFWLWDTRNKLHMEDKENTSFLCVLYFFHLNQDAAKKGRHLQSSVPTGRYIHCVIIHCTFGQFSYFLCFSWLSFSICGFKAFINFGNFSVNSSSAIFSVLLSLTSLGTPATYILVFLKLLQSSLMLFIFSPQFIFFFF